jgi:hypothetical protein
MKRTNVHNASARASYVHESRNVQDQRLVEDKHCKETTAVQSSMPVCNLKKKKDRWHD